MEKGELRVFLLATLALGLLQKQAKFEFGQKNEKRGRFYQVYVQF
jgi:hypothetical protein